MGANRMRGNGVDPAVAARIVRRFDGLNAGMKRSAFGQYLDTPVSLQPATPPSGGTSAGGGGAAGPGRFRVGISDAIRDRITEAIDATPAPVYTVTYQGMVCEAETTWDGFSNSDESYAITTAVHYEADGSNVTRAEHHPHDKTSYEDVDAHEERIGPIAACWQGSRLPMSLTVVAFEHDEGDPNAYKDEIKAIVAAAAAVIGYLYAPGVAAAALIAALSPLIVDAINWLFDTGDDQIDSPRTEVIDFTTIEQMGIHEPTAYVYTYPVFFGGPRTVVSNLYGHFFTHHSGSGARYVFGFQVERNPPFVRQEGPFL